MNLLDTISRLAVATRSEKEKILLDAYVNNQSEIFELLRLAGDPFVNFGLIRVAEILEDDGSEGTFSSADFLALCGALQTHALVGEPARQAIRDAAERCHTQTWNLVYRRVLLGTLKVIDPTLVNLVLKRIGPDATRYRIPTFRCQEAQSGNQKITGTRLVDVKLRGQRLLAILDKEVSLRASTGEPQEHAQVAQSLQALARQTPSQIVLDGVLTAQGEYKLFDLIPLADFRTGMCAKSQQTRRQMLETLQRLGAFETKSTSVLPQVSIDFASKAGLEAFERFAVEHGYSEIVIKNPNAPYACKRNNAWIIKKTLSR